jgi:DNA-binding response OmpR family regulator/TolA-binding protein
LIVDDDRSTQRFLADALTKTGFVVTVERDGEWAVKTFEKKSFDLVLLDILLPGLNGYEVAKRMQATARGRRTPLVMISGVYKNSIHQREAVQKHGAFAFLEKPIELEKLIQTLREALGEAFPQPVEPKPPPPPMEDDSNTGEFYADDQQREEAELVEVQSKVVRSAKAAGLVIKGDFSQTPFARVLSELYRWRATGALLAGRAKVKKIIYLRNGVPELVKSNLLVEALGRILVRERMITEAECEESLKRMKTTRRMQGTVLIEMGCISPYNLAYALTQQMQEKLYDAFRWDDGLYQFKPGVAPPPEPVSLGMTSAQLIVEGIRRTYDASRIARVFGDVSTQYVHPSDEPLYALQDAGLSNEETEIALVADGHKTVATLRALNVLSPVDTDKLLFALVCSQMVSLSPNPATGRPRVSIAKIAADRIAADQAPPTAKEEPILPPPLPPPRAARDAQPEPPTKGLLDLPWDHAELARKGGAAVPPPPPQPHTTPPRKSTQGKKNQPQVTPWSGSLLPELSEVTSLPRLSSDERDLREQLGAKLSAMRRADFFEVLGVQRKAGREDIKRAYFALAKEYHPDKHSMSKSAEVRELAQQMYDLISAAHDTLADPAEQERYLAELKQGVKRDTGDDVGKILAAEGRFQRGEELMNQRQYAEALKSFQEAVTLFPEEGEFYAWLGWARFQMDPTLADESLADIERSISLNPKLDKSYLFLGYIHKATGRPDKAEKQFEKAIQSNPDCTEALRELRLLGKTKH